MTALRRGLHVFLFSDNVALDDEIALKRLAVSRRLLCMGPDCGTAYLNGVGLGFANVVPRGRIGCVAASGTGLQAVASRLAALGEGISHGIGVGGRDLSDAGGRRDDEVRARAAGRRSRHAGHRADLEAAGAAASWRRSRPSSRRSTSRSWCLLSRRRASRRGSGHWVPTLEDAAARAAALARGESWSPRPFTHPAAVRAGLARVAGAGPRERACSDSSPAAPSPTRLGWCSSRCSVPSRREVGGLPETSTASSISAPTSSRRHGRTR